ncbi:MAG: hypothetical protein PWP11_3148 [Thauera sp.]|nr:hypothetical protein [Thauera sp.]
MFAPGLRIPADAIVLSKATTPEADAYSGFQRTGLADLAVRAVNVAEDDGARAVADMLAAGARETTLDQLERRVP